MKRAAGTLDLGDCSVRIAPGCMETAYCTNAELARLNQRWRKTACLDMLLRALTTRKTVDHVTVGVSLDRLDDAHSLGAYKQGG